MTASARLPAPCVVFYLPVNYPYTTPDGVAIYHILQSGQITLPANNYKIQYEWRTFEQLTGKEIYDMLQLRQQVFVVEQNCPYLDADGLDIHAHHLLAWSVEQEHPRLAGYLRVIHPAVKFPEPAIGRVVTLQSKRRTGVAREMMQHTLRFIDTVYPSQGVRISAQSYLEKFYLELGFRTVSEPYDEDGIPHVEMLYSTQAADETAP